MRAALVLGLFVALHARAAGPSTAAWLSPDSWPQGLADRAHFDQASAAEILELVAVLDQSELAGDGPLRWATQTRSALIRGWALAGGKPVEWTALAALARAEKHDEAHQHFWTTWVGEQVRLARLFPKTTSEIFPLQADDALGADQPDGSFELTFDDGPTASGGTSDSTIARLRSLNLPATFFVLGDRLANRADARALYSGFCVASHGRTHVPHTELSAAGQAQESSQQPVSSGPSRMQKQADRPQRTASAFSRYLQSR